MFTLGTATTPVHVSKLLRLTDELVFSYDGDSAGRKAAWRGPRQDLASALCGFVRDGDVVITIGAGDITRTGPELKQRLESRAR